MIQCEIVCKKCGKTNTIKSELEIIFYVSQKCTSCGEFIHPLKEMEIVKENKVKSEIIHQEIREKIKKMIQENKNGNTRKNN